MTRQPSRSTWIKATAFAAAFFAAILCPQATRAQALQVFVKDTFVASGLITDLSNCGSDGNVPPHYTCRVTNSPTNGLNISNDPEINFTTDGIDRCNLGNGSVLNLNNPNPNILGTNGWNVCSNQVYLCAQVGVSGTTSTVALDKVEFEVFRFVDGSNPLDPGSTPALKTFFIDAPDPTNPTNSGQCSGSNCTLPDFNHAYCVLWDGSQNIQGGTGKINGQYGFRVTVETNQNGPSGNIQITQTRSYPGGATLDATGATVASKNINVNVDDIHVIRSSPTIIGQVTGVVAEPYNFTYRLSKDALMYLNILDPSTFLNIRSVIPGLARTGEGNLGASGATPTLDGDFWDGRNSSGSIVMPGTYLAVFQDNASNQYGGDLSLPTTMQVAIDPLQITDIRVNPLLGGSTSLAVLSYQLTEPATVYLDIYPPGTQFCNITGLNNVNHNLTDGTFPAKGFAASSGGCNGTSASSPVSPLRSVVQQQASRTPVISFWDGRDLSGNLVGDGNYVYVTYASLPSQAGISFNTSGGNLADKRVWTSLAKNGLIPVLRGLVGITQITPQSTIIGSSPAIAGLSPFTFRYQLSRDAIVSLKIFDATGSKLVKTIVSGETRPGGFSNLETWTDGNDDTGLAVASGTYLAQLTAADATFPANISTTTALFPVDNFRITDVLVTPLLSGASDQATISYQLSQPMFVAWNIYPAGSVIVNSATSWPPCASQSPPGACTSVSVVSPSGVPVAPIRTFTGTFGGRLKITESWDGRDGNAFLVPDGNYVFTLTAQSTTTPKYFPTDKIFGNLTVARGPLFVNNFNVIPTIPQLFNSSNTVSLPPYTINYVLTRQSSVTIQILNTSLPPQVLRTLVSGSVRQNGILQTDVWDGRDDKGNFLPFGPGGTAYFVRAVAQDVFAELAAPATAQQTILYDPLRIYDLAVTPNAGEGAKISYQVSEPMTVAIKIYKPGTTFDASANPNPPELDANGRYLSLVRRIVDKQQPARVKIEDTWDGRDFTQTLIADGDYKFKIVGSTDSSAIDSVTGNVLAPAELADDRLTDDVQNTVGNASFSPQADFENNSFVFPNPVTGAKGTFSIFTPLHGRVLLNLYTISGQLILSHDFGDQPSSFQNGPITYDWYKVNQSGRTIARGLYYAVIRVEETEGGAQVLQTVRKVVVP